MRYSHGSWRKGIGALVRLIRGSSLPEVLFAAAVLFVAAETAHAGVIRLIAP